jgi:peptidoglycan/xylan/chitin deacetylase (PgdA/CDA1 family)
VSPRVCLTVDFDAVASLQTGDADGDAAAYSRRLFGPRVGVPRLLDLFDRTGVTATWFVNGHTADSFPDACAAVREAGHSVQCHGWSHTSPASFESRAAERADLERAIESVTAVAGRRPEGYRAPHWEFSRHTVDLLRELDFEWDSSLMEREFQPYYVRREDSTPADGPYEDGPETDLVEVPVSFQRDDWPPFGSGPGQSYVDERAVFRMWRDQFDWMVDHEPGGAYVLTMHPQIVGVSHRLAGLERLIGQMRRRPGVEFATVGEVAASFAADGTG